MLLLFTDPVVKVLHAQRIRNRFPDIGREPLSGHHLNHRAEHIVTHTVDKPGSRLIMQRLRKPLPDDLTCGSLRMLLHKGADILPLDIVVQAALHGQIVLDRRLPAAGKQPAAGQNPAPFRLRNIFADGILQRQSALLRKLQNHDDQTDLGRRVQPVQILIRRLLRAGRVRVSAAPPENLPVIFVNTDIAMRNPVDRFQMVDQRR